jgi:hypothetical protein
MKRWDVGSPAREEKEKADGAASIGKGEKGESVILLGPQMDGVFLFSLPPLLLLLFLSLIIPDSRH